MELSIRPEKPGDENEIRDVVYRSFLGSNRADKQGSLPTEHLIVDKLRKSNALTLSLVACMGPTIIGYAAFSKVYMTDTFCNWYALFPICILPEYRGIGIGKQLCTSAIDSIKKFGADGIVVLGDPNFFSKFGFSPNSRIPYSKGGDPKRFLCLPFKSAIPSGCVTYEKSFDL